LTLNLYEFYKSAPTFIIFFNSVPDKGYTIPTKLHSSNRGTKGYMDITVKISNHNVSKPHNGTAQISKRNQVRKTVGTPTSLVPTGTNVLGAQLATANHIATKGITKLNQTTHTLEEHTNHKFQYQQSQKGQKPGSKNCRGITSRHKKPARQQKEIRAQN
jgi:hypothetical protein